MSSKFYTGVGSRTAPDWAILIMFRIGIAMAQLGYTGRSGDAIHSDRAYKMGSRRVPGSRFVDYLSDKKYKRVCPDGIVYTNLPKWQTANEIALRIHPRPDKLNEWSLAMHGRNINQCLGSELNEPSLVLFACATPTGVADRVSGGTNTAWGCAKQFNIARFNIMDPADRAKIEAWLAGERGLTFLLPKLSEPITATFDSSEYGCITGRVNAR